MVRVLRADESEALGANAPQHTTAIDSLEKEIMKLTRYLAQKTVSLSCVVCFVAALFACVLAVEAYAAPGQNGDIAFTRNTNGQETVYVAKADGSGARSVALPDGAKSANHPRWSPNHHGELVFTAWSQVSGSDAGRLYVFNSETNGLKETGAASNGRRAFSLSYQSQSWAPAPNGEGIAFVNGDSVLVKNGKGAEVTCIFRQAGATVHSPSWSPGGKSLAFIVRDSKTKLNELIISQLDGKTSARFQLGDSMMLPASWSPNGRHITVSAEREGQHYLLDISPSESGLVAKAVRLPQNVPAIGPVWSPDGKKMIFSARVTGGNADITSIPSSVTPNGAQGFKLYVADVQETNELTLANIHPLPLYKNMQDVSFSDGAVSWQNSQTGSSTEPACERLTVAPTRERAATAPPALQQPPIASDRAETPQPAVPEIQVLPASGSSRSATSSVVAPPPPIKRTVSLPPRLGPVCLPPLPEFPALPQRPYMPPNGEVVSPPGRSHSSPPPMKRTPTSDTKSAGKTKRHHSFLSFFRK